MRGERNPRDWPRALIVEVIQSSVSFCQETALAQSSCGNWWHFHWPTVVLSAHTPYIVLEAGVTL